MACNDLKQSYTIGGSYNKSEEIPISAYK